MTSGSDAAWKHLCDCELACYRLARQSSVQRDRKVDDVALRSAVERFGMARDNFLHWLAASKSREGIKDEAKAVLKNERCLLDYLQRYCEIQCVADGVEFVLYKIFSARMEDPGSNVCRPLHIWGNLEEHALSREKWTEDNLRDLRKAMNTK